MRATSTATETTAAGPPQPIVLAYYTNTQGSYDALLSFGGSLSVLSADIFRIQSDGTIVGGDSFGMLDVVRSTGLTTYACVNNWNGDPAVDDFDPSLAHAAIVTHRDRVMANLVDLAQQQGFAGINVDFENVNYSEDVEDSRLAFSAFIHDLAARLHVRGRKLIVSVPGKTGEDAMDDWSGPFDLATLGQDADYLQLMTYDQHGPWSEPGPVSGKNWVEDCVAYSASQVDPAKLLMGLPAYGYDWDLSARENGSQPDSVSSFAWTDVPGLAVNPSAVTGWDEVSLSPYVEYRQEGHDHVAWYETGDSIRDKTRLVGQYHLAGLSVWALEMADEGFWRAVAGGLR